MKLWTAHLRHLLARALRDDAANFVVSEKRRDGVLVVRPTRDMLGIGNRLVVSGLLPEDTPDEYEILLEREQHDDPEWGCRYLHVRARAGRAFAPLDVRLAVGWPLKNGDLVVTVVRRALREMFQAAREARKRATDPDEPDPREPATA